MKLSKRLTALLAAVLMATTVFASAITAIAADASVPIQVGTGTYSTLKVTGWRSVNSRTSMKAQSTANKNAKRIAVTMVARTVDSNGNLVQAGGHPDRSKDNAKASPVANVTSGSGRKFTHMYILYAGLYDNNLNHVATTEYDHPF